MDQTMRTASQFHIKFYDPHEFKNKVFNEDELRIPNRDLDEDINYNFAVGRVYYIDYLEAVIINWNEIKNNTMASRLGKHILTHDNTSYAIFVSLIKHLQSLFYSQIIFEGSFKLNRHENEDNEEDELIPFLANQNQLCNSVVLKTNNRKDLKYIYGKIALPLINHVFTLKPKIEISILNSFYRDVEDMEEVENINAAAAAAPTEDLAQVVNSADLGEVAELTYTVEQNVPFNISFDTTPALPETLYNPNTQINNFSNANNFASTSKNISNQITEQGIENENDSEDFQEIRVRNRRRRRRRCSTQPKTTSNKKYRYESSTGSGSINMSESEVDETGADNNLMLVEENTLNLYEDKPTGSNANREKMDYYDGASVILGKECFSPGLPSENDELTSENDQEEIIFDSRNYKQQTLFDLSNDLEIPTDSMFCDAFSKIKIGTCEMLPAIKEFYKKFYLKKSVSNNSLLKRELQILNSIFIKENEKNKNMFKAAENEIKLKYGDGEKEEYFNALFAQVENNPQYIYKLLIYLTRYSTNYKITRF